MPPPVGFLYMQTLCGVGKVVPYPVKHHCVETYGGVEAYSIRHLGSRLRCLLNLVLLPLLLGTNWVLGWVDPDIVMKSLYVPEIVVVTDRLLCQVTRLRSMLDMPAQTGVQPIRNAPLEGAWSASCPGRFTNGK
jgi:hypothetical protein